MAWTFMEIQGFCEIPMQDPGPGNFGTLISAQFGGFEGGNENGQSWYYRARHQYLIVLKDRRPVIFVLLWAGVNPVILDVVVAACSHGQPQNYNTYFDERSRGVAATPPKGSSLENTVALQGMYRKTFRYLWRSLWA